MSIALSLSGSVLSWTDSSSQGVTSYRIINHAATTLATVSGGILSYDMSSSYVPPSTINNIWYVRSLSGTTVLITSAPFSPPFPFSLTSISLGNAGSFDAFLTKYDPNGSALWATRIGGTNDDRGEGVTSDSFGNVYVTGSYLSTVVSFYNADGSKSIDVSSSNTDIFLAKYNPSGTVVWATRIGGAGTDAGQGVTSDNFGNVYTTGYYSSNPLISYSAFIPILSDMSGVSIRVDGLLGTTYTIHTNGIPTISGSLTWNTVVPYSSLNRNLNTGTNTIYATLTDSSGVVSSSSNILSWYALILTNISVSGASFILGNTYYTSFSGGYVNIVGLSGAPAFTYNYVQTGIVNNTVSGGYILGSSIPLLTTIDGRYNVTVSFLYNTFYTVSASIVVIVETVPPTNPTLSVSGITVWENVYYVNASGSAFSLNISGLSGEIPMNYFTYMQYGPSGAYTVSGEYAFGNTVPLRTTVDGSYSIYVTFTNYALRSVSSDTIQVIVDTVDPPPPTLTVPGANVSNNVYYVTASGAAFYINVSGLPGISPIYSYRYTQTGPTLQSSTIFNSAYTFGNPIPLRTTVDGSYSITIMFTNRALRTTTPPPINVFVVTQPPTQPSLSISGSIYYENVFYRTFSGGYLSVSGLSGATDFTYNYVQTGVAHRNVSAPYILGSPIPLLTTVDGCYNITVNFTDKALYTVSYSITAVVETRPPQITSVAIRNSTLSGGIYFTTFSGGTIFLGFSSETMPVLLYRYSQTVVVGSPIDISGPYNGVSLPLRTTVNSSYTIAIQITDVAGRTAATNIQVCVCIPPVIGFPSILNEEKTSTLTISSATITFSGTPGTPYIVTGLPTIDGRFHTRVDPTIPSSGTVSLTFTVSTGIYPVAIQLNPGTLYSSSLQFVTHVDTSQPSSSYTNLINTLLIHASVGSTYNIYADQGPSVLSSGKITSSSQLLPLSVLGLSSGLHTITIQITDSFGNMTPYSIQMRILSYAPSPHARTYYPTPSQLTEYDKYSIEKCGIYDTQPKTMRCKFSMESDIRGNTL